MSLIKNPYNIVVVASWNLSIFSEEWIRRNISDEITDFENSIVDLQSPLIEFKIQNFKVSFELSKLIVSTTTPTDDVFIDMEDFVAKIIRVLPHTPSVAFGINIVENLPYREEHDKYFADVSDYNFDDFGCKLQFDSASNISLKYESYILNVVFKKYSKESDSLQVSYNFHFPLASLEKFSSIINLHSMIDLYNKSKSLNFLLKNYD